MRYLLVCGRGAAVAAARGWPTRALPLVSAATTAAAATAYAAPFSALCVARRAQSQSTPGGQAAPWQDGSLDPRYSSEGNMRKLNAQTMPHYVRATIQNDRREMGLGEVCDWEEFAKDAIYIPTRSGPLWVGSDDPRAAKFVRRRTKMAAQPLQRARRKPGPDAAKALEDHPLREFFTTASNLNDPLSVATGLHRAGYIREYDIKHTAARLQYTTRPPVVAIMGHVDHGKTTLLDWLRRSNVAACEAGGITQNIGAFTVRVPVAQVDGDEASKKSGNNDNSSGGDDDKKNNNKGSGGSGGTTAADAAADADADAAAHTITFIDTPGHAAFSAMREVGAQVNDVTICVVSAVDGVQEQTREVIELVQRAGAPMVVAITKIDRQPRCDHVVEQLRAAGVALEEDGGDVQVVKVCGKDGTNVDALLRAVLLQAELSEVVATPQPSRAELTVLETHDLRGASELRGKAVGAGRGGHNTFGGGEVLVAAIVRCGVVRPQQAFVAGLAYGVVRHLRDERGDIIARAGPSTPVLLSGFTAPPKPGSVLLQVSSDTHAYKFHLFMKDVYKAEGGRETYLQVLNAERHGRLYARKPDNNLVRVYSDRAFLVSCKAATFGMLQALMKTLYTLPRLDGVSVEYRVTEVGGLRDADVMLIGGSGQPGCVLIFGDCRDSATLDVPSHVTVLRFDVLYHGVDEFKRVLVQSLPKLRGVRVTAAAECRQVFRASQAGRGGNAGGLVVLHGSIDATHLQCCVRRRRRGTATTPSPTDGGSTGSSSSNAAASTTSASEALNDDNSDVVYEGAIKELRRFKELVPAVEAGLECGIIMHDEFAFRVGDVLQQCEAYETERDVDAEFAAAAERERIARAAAEHDAATAAATTTSVDEANADAAAMATMTPAARQQQA